MCCQEFRPIVLAWYSSVDFSFSFFSSLLWEYIVSVEQKSADLAVVVGMCHQRLHHWTRCLAWKRSRKTPLTLPCLFFLLLSFLLSFFLIHSFFFFVFLYPPAVFLSVAKHPHTHIHQQQKKKKEESGVNPQAQLRLFFFSVRTASAADAGGVEQLYRYQGALLPPPFFSFLNPPPSTGLSHAFGFFFSYRFTTATKTQLSFLFLRPTVAVHERVKHVRRLRKLDLTRQAWLTFLFLLLF